jgi:hypothetical protein
MRARTALKHELLRETAGPTGLVSRTAGARVRLEAKQDEGKKEDAVFDITASGGLTVGGRGVHFAGEWEVAGATLMSDTVLAPSDAGVTRVVDLTSPASTGVHVTLPPARAFVGRTFDFVVRRDATTPNNAVFSLALQDGSDMWARAIASESHAFNEGTVLTTSARTFQTKTPLLRTPGAFCVYRSVAAGGSAVAVSCYQPLSWNTLYELVRANALASSLFDNPDLTGSSLIVNSARENDLSHVPGFRVSLASNRDTIRVRAIAPDWVMAECSFRYATAW